MFSLFRRKPKEEIKKVEISKTVIDNTEDIKNLWERLTNKEDEEYAIHDKGIKFDCYDKLYASFNSDKKISFEVSINEHNDISYITVKSEGKSYQYEILTSFAKHMYNFAKPIVKIKKENESREYLKNL